MTRLLDAIAFLLVVAPLVNLYFLRLSLATYRQIEPHSPLLLALLSVELVVWLVGVFTAVLSITYLIQPVVNPTTLTGVFFGVGLLLIQALPHFIQYQMRRIEHGA